MIRIQKTFSTFALSIHRHPNFLPVIAARNYCSEKSEELKLSYLTGDKQGIAVIELNRENGKNSLNKSLVSKLQKSVDVLSHDKNVRVVIIRCDYF